MNCFVNLPIRYTQEQPEFLALFLREKICPELGLDKFSILYPDETHLALARRFQDEGLAVAIHLPFLMRIESELAQQPEKTMREMLIRGAHIAALYGARHMIGHTQYIRNSKPQRLGHDCWSEVLSASGSIPLFLENIWEDQPESLLKAVQDVPAPGAGICFDVGHWHTFSQGCVKQDLEYWMRVLAPKLSHLHLHDNNGAQDDHVGLGRGSIPWNHFFALLDDLKTPVTVTYEPHQKNALNETRLFFAQNPRYADILGIGNIPI